MDTIFNLLLVMPFILSIILVVLFFKCNPKTAFGEGVLKIARIVILLLLALNIAFLFVLTRAAGGPSDNAAASYESTKSEVENAVTAYSHANNGSIPKLSGTYTNADCSNCSVINISALIMANGGLMKTYPTGLASVGGGNDNCGGNTSLGCRNTSRYIWLVDKKGDIYSYCAGARCTTNNSGYQGVWP